jgi:hypothetical protein
MVSGGCRSSGILDTTDTTVFDGRCKLVSIHGHNAHVTDLCTVTIYDNIASSGKIVAVLALPPIRAAGVDDSGGGSQTLTLSPTVTSIEFDMHSVICHLGLRFTFSGGTPHVTIEFA